MLPYIWKGILTLLSPVWNLLGVFLFLNVMLCSHLAGWVGPYRLLLTKINLAEKKKTLLLATMKEYIKCDLKHNLFQDSKEWVAWM